MELEDGTFDFSPEEWAHERRCMAGCAMEDLDAIITCRNSDGQPFVPTKKDIADAFGLLASGLEWSDERMAPFQAEFERGLGNDAASRAVIMRAALDRLATDIGYRPQHPLAGATIRTYPLTGSNGD